MAEHLFSAQPALVRCVRGVFHECFPMRSQLLVDEEVSKLEPPCKLVNFVALQAAKCESVNANLRSVWVTACEAIILQELQAMPVA